MRAILYLLVTVFVITFLRGVIGLITKGVGDLFQPDEDNRAAAPKPDPVAKGGFGGELMKDPVCGTYVSPSTALQRKVGGKTYYFCSAECRDKFQAG